jgi:hypothetical protein
MLTDYALLETANFIIFNDKPVQIKDKKQLARCSSVGFLSVLVYNEEPNLFKYEHVNCSKPNNITYNTD